MFAMDGRVSPVGMGACFMKFCHEPKKMAGLAYG